MTLPLIQAVRNLKREAPAYFQPARGRPRRSERVCILRPPLLDLPEGPPGLNYLTTPDCMREFPTEAWRQAYERFVDQFISASPEMCILLTRELAAEYRLNKRQALRFFPQVPAHTQALNMILAFFLVGAASDRKTPSARTVLLTPGSFLVWDEASGVEWGIRQRVESRSNTPLAPFDYLKYVKGTLWRGGVSTNSEMTQAYLRARQARDKHATALLAGLYWNVIENSRITTALKPTPKIF